MTTEQDCRELSGRELARQLRADVAARAAELAAAGRQPRLAVVTANDDGGSAAYVRSITAAADRNGIACDVARTGTAAGILATLTQLADDPEVHGIILQTPLPGGANLAALAAAIPPAKDVDGASPESIGRLVAGLPSFAPATAEAVLALLDHYGVELRGRHAVVVGRSVVVGKPAAHLLLDRHATVTIATRAPRTCRPSPARPTSLSPRLAGPPDRPRACLTRHHGHRRRDEPDGGRRPHGRRGPGGGQRRGRAHPGARRRRPGHHRAAAQPRGPGRGGGK